MTISGMELGSGSVAGFFSASAGVGCTGFALSPAPSGFTDSAGVGDSCSRASIGHSMARAAAVIAPYKEREQICTI
jgi:hypothetical protein